ncbi:MAG TPA: histidine kinase [Gemmatimonadales bacterium]|nr:histidine kinase [Gemmatimonadales bacterium]
MAEPSPSEPTRRSARWGLIVAFWTVVGLLSASQTFLLLSAERQPVAPWRVILWQLAAWYFWALLTPVIAWLGRRRPIHREAWVRSLFGVHLPASVAVSLAHTALVTLLVRLAFPATAGNEPFGAIFASYLRSRLQFELLTYWAILGASHAFDFYAKYRERELRASELQAQLVQAELQALKMQLHPHFLFNTLHAIAVLIRRDPAAATRTVTLLGDLLRLTLANSGALEIPLRQELEFLKLYLEIERIRFPDRLTVVFEVEPEALDARVPNFILQPLVENAVRHGVAARTAPGRIEIGARIRGEAAELRVWNDGPGLDERPRRPAGTGIGLATTRARLARLYGPRGRFAIADAERGGVEVTLTVPYHRETDPGIPVGPHDRR